MLPPFVGVAVNVTLVPEQTVLSASLLAILTPGVTPVPSSVLPSQSSSTPLHISVAPGKIATLESLQSVDAHTPSASASTAHAILILKLADV